MSTGVIVHETCTLRNPLPPNSPPNGRKTPANGKTTTMGTGTFVVEMTFAQIKPAKINLSLFGRYFGSAASRFQVPQVAPKEERRVLWYASDGLRGEMGCLGPAQRQA